jgi:hypothetical protein
MPFQGNAFQFDVQTLNTLNEVGAVYGLFRPTPFRPGFVDCVYVGQTNNLRTRLAEHYRNPPIAGITHFFAEVISTELQRRSREIALIAELNPPGNRTRGG